MKSAADRSWRVGSIQGESHGIPYVIQAVYDERYEVIEAGLNGALGLIKSYHPIRLNQVRRSISEIWVRPLPHRAEIRPSEWACVLEGRFVATFPFEAVAASIIFNATYARIGRLPLTLRPGDLHRITRICWQAERDFGRRLPSAEAVVERAEEALAAMNEMLPLIDRREVEFRTKVMELEALNLPAFMERFARRVLERRYGHRGEP